MKLGRVRNIVVVAGAGISTGSGIPDFRWMLKTFKLLLNHCFTRLTTVFVSGRQGQVFMRTLRSMTSLTQRPSLTSTTSLTTLILSSHWLKSCTLDTTVQTMFTISSVCCIRRACCSACTLRTSTGLKNVRLKFRDLLHCS